MTLTGSSAAGWMLTSLALLPCPATKCELASTVASTAANRPAPEAVRAPAISSAHAHTSATPALTAIRAPTNDTRRALSVFSASTGMSVAQLGQPVGHCGRRRRVQRPREPAVGHEHDPVGPCCRRRVVGDHHDRLAEL